MAAPRNMSPEQRTERARIAARARWDRNAFQRWEDRAKALVESAPPLTPEQVEALRRLLPEPEGAAR